MDHALAGFVQPDEGTFCVRFQMDTETQGAKIDEFALSLEPALCESHVDALARMPSDPAFT